VSEDVADLGDVEADVDDQVTGERVPEIVEAYAPAIAIQSGLHGGSAEDALGDVVMQVRRSVRGGEHEVASAAGQRGALVRSEHRRELGQRRNLTQRSARLRRHSAGWYAAPAAGELVANVDDARCEVDVTPAEREQLRQAHAGEDRGGEERPVALRACRDQAHEFVVVQHPLRVRARMRPLVPLESLERMRPHEAAAVGVAEDAAERAEDPLDRPRRELFGAQVTDQLREIVRG
jgi:hypothetical protein